MNSLRSMLEKYGIDDPVTDDRTGRFNNKHLAALYESLVAKGKQSVNAAIEVGKEIEILDISDLKQAIAVSSSQDLIRVYQRLLNGSYNHLEAFNSYRG